MGIESLLGWFLECLSVDKITNLIDEKIENFRVMGSNPTRNL
jgi:hypothetical protein